MPLIVPVLDDRSFESLFAELRARIPVYNPAWTDHLDSDPGITLLQLFAYLGEGLQFRLNQVPEATQIAFLKLLDIPLQPAQPARALLRFESKRAEGVVLYQGDRVQAGKLGFSLDEDLTVWPLDCVTVSRRAELTSAQAADPAQLRQYIAGLDIETGRLLQSQIDAVLGELGRDVPIAPYTVVKLASDGSSPAIDPAAAVDPHLWIAVLTSAESRLLPADLTDPIRGLQNAQGRPLALSLAFRPEQAFPQLQQVEPCGTETGPALHWQASVRRSDGTLGYITLRSSADSTAGFTREGIVRVELPEDLKPLAAPDAAPGLEGTGEQPPELDDDSTERLWFWLRVWRGDGSSFPPVKWIALNAMSCEQTVAAGAELLGTGTGQPGQVWTLSQRPVAPGHAVRLQVEEEGVWQDWTGVETLDASASEDRHFSVDPEAGSLRFGVRYPQLGERIRVLGYRTGGGAAGNVPALAISTLGAPANPTRDAPSNMLLAVNAKPKLGNPFRAEGGADAESIEAALARVPAELRRNHRAVAQDDFATLARETPACEVARAECLPLFHAPSRTRKPGCVSVIVWPARDALHPTAPLPDAWLLAQVCRWLDRWRLVTTELYVAPPTYRRIAVGVALKVAPGYGLDGVRDWVNVALRQYLAPLPPYGPAGQGWPLARRVIARELEGVVMQVQGVEYVQTLRLDAQAQDGSWGAVDVQPMDDWELPELAAVTVVAELTPLPAPGLGLVPPPSRPFVPVPVLKTEC